MLNSERKAKAPGKLDVANWNRTYAVGQDVTLTRDAGTVSNTKTRSEAFLSSSGYPVIMLDGVSGYYLLSRVEAVN